jgi:hypothetical protein
MALAVVLAIVFPLVVEDTVWSADVGALLYQGSRLAEGRGWLVDHPFPAADPDGIWFPLHLSWLTDPNTVGEGYVVLAKHPVLTWLVAGLVKLGGLRAVVAVSTLGTLAAAVATARLVRRVDADLAPAALWFTGLASPLLFDGYVGYAHTIAAAAVAWATVLVLSALDGIDGGAGPAASVPGLAAALGLVALACLVRTEAAFAVGALAIAVIIDGPFSALAAGTGPGRRSRLIVSRGAVGAAVALIGAGTVLADRRAAVDFLAIANPAWRSESLDFWSARWAGLQQTWLSPGRGPENVLIALSAGAVLALGWLARRRVESWVVTVFGVLAVVAVAVRWLVGSPPLVTGLVMAFPSLFAALLTLRADSVIRDRTVRITLIAVTVFAGGVLATQYSFGGVSEWGGRYFAVGLPLAIAAALPAAATTLARLSPSPRRTIVVSVAAAALLLNALGLVGLRSVRHATGKLNDRVAAATVHADPGDGGRPVVVTTVPLAGRVAWQQVDHGRWLLVDDEELTEAGDRLAALGIRSFVLVSFEPDDDVDRLADHYRPDALAFPDPAREGGQATAPATIERAVIVLQRSDP